MEPVVGEDPYSILAIVNAMKEKEEAYSVLAESYESLGKNLKVNATRLVSIKRQVNNQTLSLDECPYEILKIWKAQVGSEATVEKLCAILIFLKHGELAAAVRSLGVSSDNTLPHPIPKSELEKMRMEYLRNKTYNDVLPLLTAGVEKDSDVYKIKATKAGKALIFNQKHFNHINLKPRHGTESDALSLMASLEVCGMEVELYQDLTTKDLKSVIKKYSDPEMYNHTEYDCIVVCVLSHGNKDFICTKDGKYPTSALWTPFEADVCPTLAGKPKIFFVQACRGDTFDGATQLATYTDGETKNESYNIPNKADFLIVHSTAEGTKSFRTIDGSWFIQSLTNVLDENKSKMDLLPMMTLVARRVAMDYETTEVNEKPCPTAKQVPTLTSTLISKVYFGKQ